MLKRTISPPLTPEVLFWRNKWSGDLGGAQGRRPIRARVTAGFRRLTAERSSPEGRRAPARTRAPLLTPAAHLGALPAANRPAGPGPAAPRGPPEPFPTKTNTGTPEQNQTYRAKPRGPTDNRRPTRLRARLGHSAPRPGAPKRERGAGAREPRDGNVKSLTNSS